MLVLCVFPQFFGQTASAASVEFAYKGTDDNGVWKVSEIQDTSTKNQFFYVYSDCWKSYPGTRYHEHIMMTKGNKPIARLTVTVQPKYYSTGEVIGSQRRYDAYNTTYLRVMPQSIASGGYAVTVFCTLEAQDNTATYTYHNF